MESSRSKGDKYDIKFDEESFEMIDDQGKLSKYKYTQNSVKSENFVETYGIKLSDGRVYHLHFPNSKNENIGLMLDETGNWLLTLSRKGYITYEEIYHQP